MADFIDGFKKGFKGFGENITLIVNTLLLIPVYLIGVGMTAFFAKLVKKHFLETGLKKGSYWSDLNLGKKPIEEYYRQF